MYIYICVYIYIYILHAASHRCGGEFGTLRTIGPTRPALLIRARGFGPSLEAYMFVDPKCSHNVGVSITLGSHGGYPCKAF